MRNGTQIMFFMVLFGLSTIVTTGAYTYKTIIEVPKLEKQVQALEQQVKAQGAKIDAKKAETKAQTEKLKELNDALYTANEQVEQLENKPKPVSSSLPSRSTDYVRELTGFQVTWYNQSGITKSGAHTEDGVTVASDPSVIPLGTRIEIEMPDGRVLKRQAQDTGGAVHGRILDVYISASETQVRKLGRTHGCIVRILQ